MIPWRPSKLALLAWASVATIVLMQYLHVAPIGNVLASAIFYIGWFISLFVVLPVGVRTQSDEGEYIRGTSAGAPVNAKAGRIIALTTIVASAVFAVILLSMRFRLIPLE
jgi:predicted secreted protein